jgi:hypothetical protein
VSGWTDVGYETGTSRLSPASRFVRAGDDGKDIGVDMGAMATAQGSGARAPDGCGEPRAVPR